jgi:hypothetical protein
VALALQLYTHDPRAIYAGLLWHALYDPHWKPWKKPNGAAAHMFRELLGAWPRPKGKVEPQPPSPELSEWIALRRKPRKPSPSNIRNGR